MLRVIFVLFLMLGLFWLEGKDQATELIALWKFRRSFRLFTQYFELERTYIFVTQSKLERVTNGSDFSW